MKSTLHYPIPNLETTMTEAKRVLMMMKPRGESTKISSVIANFVKSTNASRIQKQFEMLCEGKENWATEGFLKTLLGTRVPLPKSTMFPTMLAEDERNETQELRAASLLIGAARIYKVPSEIKVVEGDLTRKSLLQADTQDNSLGTSRLPGEYMDSLRRWTNKDHAVILFKSAAYSVKLFDETSNYVPNEIILQSIKSIMRNTESDEISVSPFTSLDRSSWNKFHENMKTRDATREALEEIESSIVVLALEDYKSPDSLAERLESITFGKQLGQRYYDKAVNIVVFADGQAGCLFEHSSIDGHAGVVISETIHRISTSCTFEQKSSIDTKLAKPLRFMLTEEEIRQMPKPIESGKDRKYIDFIIPLPTDAIELLCEQRIFGTWIILSTMLAYIMQFGHLEDLIVQPSHVRHFHQGRVDPVYPITESALKLFKSLSDNLHLSIEDKLQLFTAAVLEQKSLVKKVKEGHAVGPHIGFLRHLLKNQQNQENEEIISLLNIFSTTSVMLNGSNQSNLTGTVGAAGNVYLKDQMSLNYCLPKQRLVFTIVAQGKFASCVNEFKNTFIKSMLQLAELAVPFAIIQQMEIPASAFKPQEQKTEQKTQKDYSIALHVGASSDEAVDPKAKQLISFAIKSALQLGVHLLGASETSIDAVEKVTKSLENCFLFNAGKGAVFNSIGTHELEACIMDGKTKSSGGVACVKTIKNPISAARLVQSSSQHKLLSGQAADSFGKQQGLENVLNKSFSTAYRSQQWKETFNNNEEKCTIRYPETVGVIALDVHGNLATSSSTGGVMGKLPGRVGDSAIQGAGLFANEFCAVTCSGHGEVFIENMVGYSVANQVKNGVSLDKACDVAMTSLPNKSGGILAMDGTGKVTCTYNSDIMLWGSANSRDSKRDSKKKRFQKKQETKEIPKEAGDKLFIWENEKMTAFLDPTPFLPGTIIVTFKHLVQRKLSDLDEDMYSELMMSIQQVAEYICKSTGVQRCAVVSDCKQKGFVHALVIPIDGLSDSYKPVLSEITEFFEDEYPGYITSNNGPRMNKSKLDNIQSKILAVGENRELLNKSDKTFLGDESDTNLFARIIRGEEEQWRIWEDKDHVSFLTPFPNTPGFSVVVPRKHLSSDVLSLDKEEFKKLMLAARMTGKLIQKALKAEDYAIICEGLEIDYAHVKVVPVYKSNGICAAMDKINGFVDKYPGYVSSKPGLKVSDDILKKMHEKMRSLKAPKTWKDPNHHSISAFNSPWYRAIFKLQNTLYDSTNAYFKGISYNHILTPVTTNSISSPMGLGSDSLPVHANILGQDVYLADSMQFILEYALRMGDEKLPGAYYISSSFRGEDPDATHLNQFFHVECELKGGLDMAIQVGEGYIRHLTKSYLMNHADIIESSAGTVSHVEGLLEQMKNHLPRVTFKEAVEIFKEYGIENATLEPVEEGRNELGLKVRRAGEQKLIEHFGGAVWLTHMKHLSVPFYQAYDDTSMETGRCADLLLGIGEILGLGERHLTKEEVEKALDHHTTPRERYEWYTAMRENMPLLTSGWGMGVERYMMWLLQHDDIRDLHIFPRLKNLPCVP